MHVGKKCLLWQSPNLEPVRNAEIENKARKIPDQTSAGVYQIKHKSEASNLVSHPPQASVTLELKELGLLRLWRYWSKTWRLLDAFDNNETRLATTVNINGWWFSSHLSDVRSEAKIGGGQEKKKKGAFSFLQMPKCSTKGKLKRGRMMIFVPKVWSREDGVMTMMWRWCNKQFYTTASNYVQKRPTGAPVPQQEPDWGRKKKSKYKNKSTEVFT